MSLTATRTVIFNHQTLARSGLALVMFSNLFGLFIGFSEVQFTWCTIFGFMISRSASSM